jgi:S-adenosylmethionine:tRNA ribosyltransferase-isomerase
LLEPNDCVVVNDTKVLPARLVGTRNKTGGRWEGLFLSFDSNQLWKIIGKTRGKIQPGELVQLQTSEGHIGFSLEFGTKLADGSWIVKPQTNETPLSALEHVGWIPIPHYIRNGRMLLADKETYQTVYASKPGAVAAPTAGLHFTPQLFNNIKQQGINIVPVTLHVGMGTFKPITVENIHEHPMHAEWCSLTKSTSETLQHCKVTSGRIIAVGTTSVRVLESATDLKPFEGETSLFIRPPYQFKNVDALLTNFHLPKSTLLILVRTFGGDELIQEAYQEAIRKKYRFFSYGDAMLIY